jgi:hypothetical protein
LGTTQDAFEEAGVPYARRTAEPLEQDTVNFQCQVAIEKGNVVTWRVAYPALRFRRWIAPGAS